MSPVPEPLIDDRSSSWCILGPRAPKRCEGRPRASNNAAIHQHSQQSLRLF